jgi:hypothetical protein
VTDLRYQMVWCRGCGKQYRCTPDQDYFHKPETGEPMEINGYCWDCFLEATGMRPQSEPGYKSQR